MILDNSWVCDKPWPGVTNFPADLTFSSQARNFILFVLKLSLFSNRRTDEICTLFACGAAGGRRLCSGTEAGAFRFKSALYQVRISDTDARRRSSFYVRLCPQGCFASVPVSNDAHPLQRRSLWRGPLSNPAWTVGGI